MKKSTTNQASAKRIELMGNKFQRKFRTGETWFVPKKRLRLQPTLSIKKGEHIPKVTIAIPSYKRRDKLIRCLESLTQQDDQSFKVIISNDDPNSKVDDIIRDHFHNRFSHLELYQQPDNLGSLANFNFLLQKADTIYFMWLANDDEISSSWVRDLSELLDQNPTAACAMGNWIVGKSLEEMKLRQQALHSSDNKFFRVLNYIWEADDAFFYGIFRREALINGHFKGYLWPNNGYIRNWCYVFLISPILYGKVLYTTSCNWYNHDYGEKHYPGSPNGILAASRVLTNGARRLNVHFLYCVEIASKHPLILLPAIVTSILSLFREVAVNSISKFQKIF